MIGYQDFLVKIQTSFEQNKITVSHLLLLFDQAMKVDETLM